MSVSPSGARPAAARGWRYSSSRAGGRCRRHCIGGRSRNSIMTSENGAVPAEQEKRRLTRRYGSAALGPGVARAPGIARTPPPGRRHRPDQHHAQARGSPGRHRVPRATGWRLATQMSRHISGMTAGDAGEVAETARRMREQQRRVATPGGSSTRPKASRCGRWLTAAKTRSLSCGVMADHVGNCRPPRVARLLDGLGATLGQRRQHDPLRPGRARRRRPRPALLGAGDRCAGTRRRARRQVGAQRGDHVAFGAAGVGDDGAGAQVRRHRGGIASVCPTGAASSTRSAPSAHPPSPRRSRRSRRAHARSSTLAPAADADMRSTAPARRSASAGAADQPDPQTTSLPIAPSSALLRRAPGAAPR